MDLSASTDSAPEGNGGQFSANYADVSAMVRARGAEEQYRLLKEQYVQLQLAYRADQDQSRRSLDQLTADFDEKARQIGQLQKKLVDAEQAIVVLRQNALTVETEELIRLKVADELERKYADTLKKCAVEVDDYRQQLSKLHLEHEFLKGEYQNDRENFRREQADARRRIDAEMAALQRERELILTRDMSGAAQEASTKNQLQVENRSLTLKVQALIKEIDEQTAIIEKVKTESAATIRELTKKLSRHKQSEAGLEVERNCVREQNDKLQRELNVQSESVLRLTGRLNEVEREKGLQQANSDGKIHQLTVELNQVKVQCLNDKADLEHERRELTTRVKELEAETSILRRNIEDKASALSSKDVEHEQALASLREHYTRELSKAEIAKIDLTSKISSARRTDDRNEQVRNADELSQKLTELSHKLQEVSRERDHLAQRLASTSSNVENVQPIKLSGRSTADDSVIYEDEVAYSKDDYIKKLKNKIRGLEDEVKHKSSELQKLHHRSVMDPNQDSQMKAQLHEWQRCHNEFNRLLAMFPVDPVSKEDSYARRYLSDLDAAATGGSNSAPPSSRREFFERMNRFEADVANIRTSHLNVKHC